MSDRNEWRYRFCSNCKHGRYEFRHNRTEAQLVCAGCGAVVATFGPEAVPPPTNQRPIRLDPI
jgi:hypothetical protein